MVFRKEIGKTLTVLALAFAASPSTGFSQEGTATAPTATPQPAMVSLKINYYACEDPTKCLGVAITEKDKKDCPECKKWTQKFLEMAGEIDLPRDSFSYSVKGPPSNRQFLDSASKQAYG